MPIQLKTNGMAFKDTDGTYKQFDAIKGEGLPKGGTTEQVLTKKSNTDYDTEWKTIVASSSAGINTSRVLASGDWAWRTIDYTATEDCWVYILENQQRGPTETLVTGDAIVTGNKLGFAVASMSGGAMWGGFGIQNGNNDSYQILYSTFIDLTDWDKITWTKTGIVSQQMWLQNESGQNVATLIDYTNHSNTNATPYDCSSLSGKYRLALTANTNSSGSSSYNAYVKLTELAVSRNSGSLTIDGKPFTMNKIGGTYDRVYMFPLKKGQVLSAGEIYSNYIIMGAK